MGARASVLLVRGDAVSGHLARRPRLVPGQAARGAVVLEPLLRAPRGRDRRDVMDTEPVTVPGDATRRCEAQDEFFLRYRWPWFPVVDARRPLPRRRCARSRVDGAVERRPARRCRRRGGRGRPDDAASASRATRPLEQLLGSEALRAPRRADGRRRRRAAVRRRHGRAGPPRARRRRAGGPVADGLSAAHRPVRRAPATGRPVESTATAPPSHASTRRPHHRRRPRRPARRPGRRRRGRVGGDHEQGPPGPLALGRRRRRHQRGDQPRRRLALARLRHRQGLGLPRRPGRDRDHVPRGARARSCTSSTSASPSTATRRASSTCAPSAAPR